MNVKRIVAALVFADFAALNVWAMSTAGWDGMLTFFANMGPWGYVVCADILIALSIVLIGLWADAREKGRNPLGFTALTLMTGSLGPLLYVATDAATESESAKRLAAS